MSFWGKDTSRFFKVVNFELYAKPNVTVGLLGTGAFVGILSVLLWQKRQFELRERQLQQQKDHIKLTDPKAFHDEE